MATLDELRDLVDRFCRLERFATAIPQVTLIRSKTVTVPIPTLYQPVFCIAAQGRKRVMQGDTMLEYGAGGYIVATLDLPVSGEICEASPNHPYLAFSLGLDTALLAEILLDLPELGNTTQPVTGLAVSTLTDDLLDPVIRLLRLIEQPHDIPMLGPLITREIHYRLLQGEQAPMLRQMALADSRLSQIGRSIDWIRRNFDRPLRVRTLADIARMSESSFHRHFKAATGMSPLQYQKQIRLQEARRLLVSRTADAAGVGFTVGYESPSQFSREYRRLFGAPPGRDAAMVRSQESGNTRGYDRLVTEAG